MTKKGRKRQSRARPVVVHAPPEASTDGESPSSREQSPVQTTPARAKVPGPESEKRPPRAKVAQPAAPRGAYLANLLDLRIPLAAQIAVFVMAAVLFGAIVSLRGGPTVNDAEGVVVPATALSQGDLHGVTPKYLLAPNPPGYPLLTAPFVAGLHSSVGAPDWCKTGPDVPGCINTNLNYFTHNNLGAARPSWYHSQALLMFLAWVVLELGVIALVRASGRGGTLQEALAVLMVAATPAVADAAVEAFHPQDLLCMGLIALGLAAALRRRWVLVGLAFGCGFLTQQFALLALVPVLVAAPDNRRRMISLGCAAAVVAIVLAPFFIANPDATIHSLAAKATNPAMTGSIKTFLGTASNYTPTTRYVIGRYGPFVLVALACWLAWRRRRASLLEPVVLVGLVTACLASRLVLELAVLRYYFVATSVMLIALDCACRRWPVWSAAWIGATSLWWYDTVNTATASRLVSDLNPVVLLVLALAAMGIGLRPLYFKAPSAKAVRRPPRRLGVRY